MPADYTTTRLIAQVRMRGMIPAGDKTFSDQNIVDLANEALQSYIVPKLLQVNEGYFVKHEDVSVSSGIDMYSLPTRAITGRVRDVQLAVTDGSVTRYVPLERIEEERLHWTAGSGTPEGYVLRGNSIILSPTPDADCTVRVLYYRRPGELILEADADELTTITDNGTYYVTNVAYAAGYYDIIKIKGLFDWAVYNLQAVNVTSKIAFLKTACEGVPEVGDFLCETGLSPVPQIPAELRTLLFERIKFECLNAIGDPKASAVEAACDRRWQGTQGILSNRGEGKARVIINPHGPGMRRFNRQF
jgi:hypothetical protein